MRNLYHKIKFFIKSFTLPQTLLKGYGYEIIWEEGGTYFMK